MARFLLTTMLFSGHVAPMTAIAGELVARGHDVRFYTGSRFRAKVEAVGARLVPWHDAPDFDENDLPATFPRLVGKKGFRQLLINVADCFIATAPAQVRDLAAEWERDPWDALAADEASVGAVLFSESRRMPWSTLAVIPLNLVGIAGPPSGMGLRPGTNPVTKTRDAALRALVPLLSRPLAKPIADARRAVGLIADGRTMDKIVFSKTLIAASGSPLLDYERCDRPAHLRFVGEIAAQATASVLPDWWGDLDGRTVVLVTQGTQNIDPNDLVRPTLEALAERDVIVVATTGIRGRDSLPFPVPSNARVIGLAPFGDLLPRVDVAITNGGWGGTLAMLSRGVPVVMGGGDLDKPEVASRVAWTGAGVNLHSGTPTASAIRDAVDVVQSEPSYRAAAARVGEQLRSLGGAEAAADLFEQSLVLR